MPMIRQPVEGPVVTRAGPACNGCRCIRDCQGWRPKPLIGFICPTPVFD